MREEPEIGEPDESLYDDLLSPLTAVFEGCVNPAQNDRRNRINRKLHHEELFLVYIFGRYYNKRKML